MTRRPTPSSGLLVCRRGAPVCAPVGRGTPGARACPAGAPLLLSKAVGKPPGPAFFEVASRGFSSKAPPAPSTLDPGAYGGIVGTSYGSLASPQAAKLVPSTVPPLPTEPASLGFGGGPVFAYVTDAAAPRVARIVITPQTLGVTALYQVRPPGRHRCHAAEIPGRSSHPPAQWGPRRSPAKRVRWGEEAQRRE